MWFARAISSKVYFREVGGLNIQTVIVQRGRSVVSSIIRRIDVGDLGFVWCIYTGPSIQSRSLLHDAELGVLATPPWWWRL